MSKVQLCLILLVLGVAVVVPAVRQRQAQAVLRRENAALQERADRLVAVAADNQRLSNTLKELRLAQADAHNQFPELVALRAEVARLKEQTEQSNRFAALSDRDQRGELARLRAEVGRLSEETEELATLRDEVQRLRTASTTPAPEETRESDAPQEPESEMVLRLIRTQGEPFAEKLKSSVGAKDEETFAEVFGRFLQLNGIQTNGVATAVYDQRTGRVIVRGTTAALDQVERATRALDQAP